MGNKNNVILDYLKEPRRFADVFNGYFGKGEMLFNPKYLKDSDSKLTGSVAKSAKTGERSREIERIRDVRKIYKDNTMLQILCLEDQDYVDYTSAVRTLTMDALEYQKQLDEIKRKHREANDLKDTDEYECGISRTDKVHPIITLWWYHGSKDYDGPYCLKDTIESAGEYLDKYVSDYRMNILTTEKGGISEYFHTEFKYLYETLAIRNDKIALRKLFKEDDAFKSIDDDTLRAISVATDRPRIWENRDKTRDAKGGYNMCLAFDEIEADARAAGVLEGRAAGILEGKSEESEKRITDMLRRGKTVDEIVDFCNYPYELVSRIESELFAMK